MTRAWIKILLKPYKYALKIAGNVFIKNAFYLKMTLKCHLYNFYIQFDILILNLQIKYNYLILFKKIN